MRPKRPASVALLLVSLVALIVAFRPDLLQPANASSIFYVKPDGLASGTCGSWAEACNLRQALSLAAAGDQIWVARGIHRPTTAANPTDRTATFQLVSGARVYGGFAGDEASLAQRDWRANETVLSGDIGAPGYHADNIYHVVTTSDTAAGTLLDGFTITGGHAEGASGDGGGIYNSHGSPALANLTIKGNWAVDSGGGMANLQGSSATLINVVLSGNYADDWGGAIYNNRSSLSLTNVTISGNKALYENSGGLYNTSSPDTATLTNCIVWGNLWSQIVNYATIVVTYSIVEGGYPGVGNLNQNPQFVAPVDTTAFPNTSGNLRPQATSPAINVGSNAALPPDTFDMDGDGDTSEAVPFDLDGNARLAKGTVDLGAYEYPNQAPVVEILAGTSIDEGGRFTSSGSFSDADGTSWAAAVDYGDGSGSQALPLGEDRTYGLSHTYDDGGAYTITVTVTDEEGAMGSGTTTATVNNVAPTATFNAPVSVEEGTPMRLSLTNPYDPSIADTAAGFSYAFDCGASYGPFGIASAIECPTSSPGSRTVRGKIRDKDGGTTEYTAEVMVNATSTPTPEGENPANTATPTMTRGPSATPTGTLTPSATPGHGKSTATATRSPAPTPWPSGTAASTPTEAPTQPALSLSAYLPLVTRDGQSADAENRPEVSPLWERVQGLFSWLHGD